jgi:biopolymer transport protein TolQ
MIQTPFAHYLAVAGPVVQFVLLLLILASIFSWMIVFQRWFSLGRAGRAVKRFEKQFLKHTDQRSLFQTLEEKQNTPEGLASIFHAAYKELLRQKNIPQLNRREKLDAIARTIRVSANYEEETLSGGLSFLATVGSVSPYVGLFGTVWGIMMSFYALGGAQQVTISMVAPGIAEALIATAMGLFAAIPAVIFYNHYRTLVNRIATRYDIFQQECLALLSHQLNGTTEEKNHA